MLFLFINSCKKDSTNFSNEVVATSEELGNAKAWFNNNALALNKKDFILYNNNNWLNTLSPNWAKKVKLIDNNKQQVFEVELNNPNKIFSAGEDFDVKNIKKYRDRSLFKLLIFYDKKEDQYKSAIVELIAFEENDMPIQQIQYKQYGTFTGAINYYSLNGQMVNGWIFKNGKVTSKTNKNVKLNLLLNKEGKANNANGKIMLAEGGGIECGTRRIQHWTQSCITVESIVELNDQGITTCRWKVEYTTEIIYCPSYDDETDPGVYTGGSTPPNLVVDCNGVAGGTAYTNQDCKTCMGGTTGITECPPKEIINNLKDPCLKSTFEAITNTGKINNTINNLIQGIFNVNDQVNLIYNEVTNLANTRMAETDAGYNGKIANGNKIYDVTVNLNANVLPGYSQELTSVTILHEALHGYFEYKNIFRADATAQHLIMATKYVDLLRTSVQSIYPITDIDANILILSEMADIYTQSPQTYINLLAQYNITASQYNIIIPTYKSGSAGTRCGNQ